MKEVTIDGLKFEEYISYKILTQRIEELAHQLREDYAGKKPVFVVVLKGAILFASELIKRFDGECEIEFVQLSSYQGTKSTQQVKEKLFIQNDITNRDVIIVEDIVDTGHTLHYLLQRCKEMHVRSTTTAVLLFKPQAYQYNYRLDYVAFEIPPDFVVGFGLDYNEKGRNLLGIFKLKNV